MIAPRWNIAAFLLVSAACQATTGPRIPWAEAPNIPPPDAHAYVRTLNTSYARDSSHVLVREIISPTRAALDYAAYHANFMFTTEPQAVEPLQPTASSDTLQPFGGLVSKASLTANLSGTPLSPSERAAPLAFEPLAQFLQSQHVGGAAKLDVLADAVRTEAWGGSALPGQPPQRITEAYIHDATGALELWVKIEVAPWFRGLGDLPDPDRDGYPEVYGRVRADHAKLELLETIRAEYATRVVSAEEISIWAKQLAGGWQRTFDAQLLKPSASWPDAQTEPEIVEELAGLSVREPSVVLRGKARGHVTYIVLSVKRAADGLGSAIVPGSRLEASVPR